VKTCKRIVLAMVLSLAPTLAVGAGFETGIVQAGDGSLFRTNSIPTVARLASGKLMAVWSAYAKGEDRGRIVASFSGDAGRTWSRAVDIIKNPDMDDGDPNIVVDGKRVFVYSTTTAVEMKFITGSKVFMVESDDEGATWTKPLQIPFSYAYLDSKVQNGIKLMDGTLMMGFSWDLWAQAGKPARHESEMNLATGVLRSTDGVHWTAFGELHVWTEKMAYYSVNGLCEPSLVQLANGDILMLMRAGTMFHWESRSHDGGLTWDPPKPSKVLGFNNPASLWRLDEKPDEIIVVFNNSPINRWPLSVALSRDGGVNWTKSRDIAAPDGLEVSYPNITQAPDGTIVVVWQQKVPDGGRDVRWARFSRAWVLGEER
jgi:hypothetical protein